MKKDVIIADKQDITCIGMQTLIYDSKKDLSILKADSKVDLLKLLVAKPDTLVVLDYTLFDFASADELLNAAARFEQSHWLLFSEELSDEFLRRVVLNCSAFSIVLKSSDLDEITTALTHTLRGERFICSRITNQLLQPQRAVIEKTDIILTVTEKEILKEIASGKTTKEIAFNRNLSFHTIITHRKNIFRKLDVNNVHEAIKYAMRAGIVDVADYYI